MFVGQLVETWFFAKIVFSDEHIFRAKSRVCRDSVFLSHVLYALSVDKSSFLSYMHESGPESFIFRRKVAQYLSIFRIKVGTTTTCSSSRPMLTSPPARRSGQRITRLSPASRGYWQHSTRTGVDSTPDPGSKKTGRERQKRLHTRAIAFEFVMILLLGCFDARQVPFREFENLFVTKCSVWLSSKKRTWSV